MKVSFVLTITSCVFAGTAFNYYPNYVHNLEVRHVLLQRADDTSNSVRESAASSQGSSGRPSRKGGLKGSSAPNTVLRKAERKASLARNEYHNSRDDMQNIDESNAWTQSDRYLPPEVKNRESKSVIDQGERVVSKQRQRGYAYSAAAQAAGAANNPQRELRNARKAEAAFAGAWAASREMQYASTKVAHAARPDLYSDLKHKKQLSDEKAAYISANERAGHVRGKGGRDSDSESDSESHGKPILPLATSVHGLGRDSKLYKQIKAHQEEDG